MTAEKKRHTCSHGHTYYKRSDCRTCPTCEAARKPSTGFLARLGSPARNALLAHGLGSLSALSQCTEKEILGLHGIGKTSIPILAAALAEEGLSFREEGSAGAT
ncbi:hypothetical protein BC792_11359 [Sphingobacterium allocomposti]|uniref:RNA polymerase alpha subunit n=1 Tax=Sphingobacterium allocomposti TaxID=415956 RepID=A0A5S5DE82_9SPHI|nr:hypothetical protein [Sphingobacterium composti Yoo et al. 2007 non Ten et al. 2007]TYP94191.1 hypothetical protein BC792_11359 [Sphingobacterium composti Yoo et al. 2007 non Ten et al. 2007]